MLRPIVIILFIITYRLYGDHLPSFADFEFGSFLGLGHQKSRLDSITKGLPAKKDWPFFTSIFHADFSKNQPICGGVLINQLQVLTAAHCFGSSRWISAQDTQKFWVRVGLSGTQKNVGIKRNLKKILIHQDYYLSGNPQVPYNDLAILQLSERVDLEPVTLIPPEVKYLESEVLVRGFGATNNKENLIQPDFVPDLPTQLQQTRLKVFSFKSCAPRDQRPDHTMLCTREMVQASQTCLGDSGGPVILEQEDRKYLVGLVSWSPYGRCGKNDPNYLVKISHFMDWIQSVSDHLIKRFSTEDQ